MALMTATDLPDRFAHARELDEFLTRPSEPLVEDLLAVPGDIMVIGAAGRLGPLVACLARKAAAGRRVIGVGNFGDPSARHKLETAGIETILCDPLDEAEVALLPQAPNVILAAPAQPARIADPAALWAVNTLAAAAVARHFASSRIVAFSSGDIYPPVSIAQRGADEATPPAASGEAAQSILGRERILQFFSARHDAAGRILRLHHPVDVRAGVLFDLASRIHAGQPVDLSLGAVTVIWQGDAASMALRALRHTSAPTTPLNVSGPEILPLRWLATELGRRLDRAPGFTGAEPPVAQVMNTSAAAGLFGYPIVPVAKMLDWTADWVARGMPHFGKPNEGGATRAVRG